MMNVSRAASTPVQCLESDRTMTLVLNSPERGNALSDEMVEALLAMVGDAIAGEHIDTVILQGQGRHFCTGFDLSDLDQETDASLLRRFVRVEQLLDMIWRAPVRTVAFAHGRVVGAGADILMACDHRILTTDATVSFPGARFGLVLGSRRLAQRVGTDRAMRILSEGSPIRADEAQRSGLATELFDGGADNWTSASLPEVVLDTKTLGAIKQACEDDGADRDLAALVRSAAKPGLKQRIIAYRQIQMGKSVRR